ncbi:DNA gyrase inhibitor [Agromyces rhizosphaerae]|uniref:DNA gyrase inhibitor n=1 Tax=Agromyces rhizosphaerae TaxID=88374 RepID=A0A9W6FS52_9MICO|nr:GyrI-like domain-containing protein [Agromyces rhizosphaerae]GLI28367.1 DNA gyrase inhibitor [Agromyces rhizosphaerae]
MADISIGDRAAQPTASIRETVPMPELSEFFARAYPAIMRAVGEQGVQPAGAPFAIYHGMPGATADVEAGIPVAGAFTDTGKVGAGELPAGTVASTMHVGPYETLGTTWDELGRAVAERGLVPSDTMWECYLSDPEEEPDPAAWRTEVCWLLA